MCPGPSIITWTSYSQAFLVNSPKTFSSENCASSLASARQPGRRPSPSEKLTSYFWKILQISSKRSYRKFCFLWALIHRSEEHTSELQSRGHLVCRLLLEKKKHV